MTATQQMPVARQTPVTLEKPIMRREDAPRPGRGAAVATAIDTASSP